MKNKLMGLLLAVVMASESISTLPALATETNVHETVIVDEEKDSSIEESSEGNPKGVIEEEPSQDTAKSADNTEEIIATENSEVDSSSVADTSVEIAEIEEPATDAEDDTSGVASTSAEVAEVEEPTTDTEEEVNKSEGKDVTLAIEGDVADSGTCGDNLTWVLDSSGTLKISGTGEMDDFSWSVRYRDYRSVDGSLLPPWFNCKDSITRIVIDEGVSSIGRGAFTEVGENGVLESISIPSTVNSIGPAAFAFTRCPSIEFGDHPIEFVDNSIGCFRYAQFDEVVWGYDYLPEHIFFQSNIKKISLIAICC